MTDLTKITTPYGLLDKDTQEALKTAHSLGKTIQIFDILGKWSEVCNPKFDVALAYRVKPEPVTVVNKARHICAGNFCMITLDISTAANQGTLTTTLDEDGRPVRAVWEADE
jgi:hypothetical protein